MKDVYFTLVIAALAATAVASYAVHVVRFGAVRTERLTRVGTSVMLGRDLAEMGQWAAQPIARACARVGITANGLTWLALATGAGAGVALGFGLFGLGALLALISVVCDLLDGQVARLTGMSSDAGEVLDAVVDRYTELFFVGGLVVHLRASLPAVLLAMAALLACFMLSYGSAKAEALGVAAPPAPMRRHERAAYLITGASLTSLLGPLIARHWPALPTSLPQLVALGAIAVVGNYAAAIRFVRIAALVRAKAARTGDRRS